MPLNEENEEGSGESGMPDAGGHGSLSSGDEPAELVASLNRVIKNLNNAPERETTLVQEEARQQNAVIASAEEEVEFQKAQRHGVEGYYELRKQWSRYLVCFLGSSILFQFLLTVSIGLKWLDFAQNQAILKMVVGENFLQIAGMGYIIVKFLYPEQKSDQKPTTPATHQDQPKRRRNRKK